MPSSNTPPEDPNAKQDPVQTLVPGILVKKRRKKGQGFFSPQRIIFLLMSGFILYTAYQVNQAILPDMVEMVTRPAPGGAPVISLIQEAALPKEAASEAGAHLSTEKEAVALKHVMYLLEGKGRKARCGDRITLHYHLHTPEQEGSALLYSTKKLPGPVTLRLGTGQLLPEIAHMLLGMPAGSLAQRHIETPKQGWSGPPYLVATVELQKVADWEAQTEAGQADAAPSCEGWPLLPGALGG